ncbi:ABC transporter permease [Bacillus pseudomycoides]|uniref:ABC transporter permease n=1 Tax=Bacillus bingmayongensis TaxID=1150157 RepID=A0ABU5K201_9BACI|nr:ABC transporter permease [Bacillus pseudomycoides]
MTLLQLIRPSAFRAVKAFNQNVLIERFQQITYETKQFDLKDEYNISDSTFVPKRKGVYAITAGAAFLAKFPFDTSRTTTMLIRVNDIDIVKEDYHFVPELAGRPYAVRISTILQLNKRDKVQVWTIISGGNMTILNNEGTHFEAARFPSP